MKWALKMSVRTSGRMPRMRMRMRRSMGGELIRPHARAGRRARVRAARDFVPGLRFRLARAGGGAGEVAWLGVSDGVWDTFRGSEALISNRGQSKQVVGEYSTSSRGIFDKQSCITSQGLPPHLDERSLTIRPRPRRARRLHRRRRHAPPRRKPENEAAHPVARVGLEDALRAKGQYSDDGGHRHTFNQQRAQALSR